MLNSDFVKEKLSKEKKSYFFNNYYISFFSRIFKKPFLVDEKIRWRIFSDKRKILKTAKLTKINQKYFWGWKTLLSIREVTTSIFSEI